jgi:hypothetical protein
MSPKKSAKHFTWTKESKKEKTMNFCGCYVPDILFRTDYYCQVWNVFFSKTIVYINHFMNLEIEYLLVFKTE